MTLLFDHIKTIIVLKCFVSVSMFEWVSLSISVTLNVEFDFAFYL